MFLKLRVKLKNVIKKSNLKFLEKTILKTDDKKLILHFNEFFNLIYDINDYKLQSKYYIKFSSKRSWLNDEELISLAFLKDSISIKYMQKQHYGTQFIKANDKLYFYPIINVANEFDSLQSKQLLKLNDKRKKLKMIYIEDYIREISNETKLIISSQIYNINKIYHGKT